MTTSENNQSEHQGKLVDFVESTLFKSRWILIFFYAGVMAGAALLAVKFVLEFGAMLVEFPTSTYDEFLLSVLALVDMALIANLLLMVSFVGYDHFISRLSVKHEYPTWLRSIDHNDLKLKMMGSIAAISAIKLLQVFMDLEAYAGKEHQLYWMVGIHLTIVVSGLILSLSDRLSHGTDGVSEGMVENRE